MNTTDTLSTQARRRNGALRDHDLSTETRAKLLPVEVASAETLRTLAGKSHAHVESTLGGKEVRLEEITPVGNQGGIGSCYSNAFCDAMELMQPRGRVVQLSRMFAHWNSRRQNGDENEDTGTWGQVISSVTRKIGVCRETSWPYDGREAKDNARLFVRPELKNYEEAYDHRCDASFALTGTTKERIEQVIKYIDIGFPSVVAFGVSAAWDDVAIDTVLMPPSAEEIDGYHALIIDGYIQKSDGNVLFDIRNSWGESWGRRGHVYVDGRYLDKATCDRIDVVKLSPSFGGP